MDFSRQKLLRSAGIEPAAKLWKSSMLPLHHERVFLCFSQLSSKPYKCTRETAPTFEQVFLLVHLHLHSRLANEPRSRVSFILLATSSSRASQLTTSHICIAEDLEEYKHGTMRGDRRNTGTKSNLRDLACSMSTQRQTTAKDDFY